jgi:hypothetical protein
VGAGTEGRRRKADAFPCQLFAGGYISADAKNHIFQEKLAPSPAAFRKER